MSRLGQLAYGAALGAIVGLPWLGLSLVGARAGFPVVPFKLFEWITRVLPGGVVTAGLEIMIGMLQALNLGPTAQLGKAIEQGMAFLLALALLAAASGAYAAFLAGRAGISPGRRALIMGSIVWFFSVLVAGGISGSGLLWLAGLSLAWAGGTVWGIHRSLRLVEAPTDTARRAFVARLGLGSAALTALSVGLGRWLLREEERVALPAGPAPEPLATTPAQSPTTFVSLPGTRPEITPIEEFYRVDINILPPSPGEVEAQSAGQMAEVLRAQGELLEGGEGYRLVVDGLVERPLALSLEELEQFPIVEQYATLECISNRVGGDLISTTLFSGVPLGEVLTRAGLQPEAVDVKFYCADGYTESLPIDSALDPRTLLVTRMGGLPLTPAHGQPVRLYTPNRFGMKNPKWIIRLEMVAEDYRGYWEQRGWSEDAWVQTTSVVDAYVGSEAGVVEAGGIAYAGARGIAAVEVRLDEGPWVPADLDRALSHLTWVLWRVRMSASPGRHLLEVRAVDGQGEVQTGRAGQPYPDGATGYHSRRIEIKG